MTRAYGSTAFNLPLNASAAAVIAAARTERELELVGEGNRTCLLYTSDAADDLLWLDLGGRRTIQKKNNKQTN